MDKQKQKKAARLEDFQEEYAEIQPDAKATSEDESTEISDAVQDVSEPENINPETALPQDDYVSEQSDIYKPATEDELPYEKPRDPEQGDEVTEPEEQINDVVPDLQDDPEEEADAFVEKHVRNTYKVTHPYGKYQNE